MIQCMRMVVRMMAYLRTGCRCRRFQNKTLLVISEQRHSTLLLRHDQLGGQRLPLSLLFRMYLRLKTQYVLLASHHQL